MAKLFANRVDPDHMLHLAASDLGLHCLPNTLLGASRLKWNSNLEIMADYNEYVHCQKHLRHTGKQFC